VEAFGEQLEVVDQVFHVRLHADTRRRRDLVVGRDDRPGFVAQPGDALLDDPVGLAHLFDAHQVAVVGVAVDSTGMSKSIKLVDVVGLLLAKVPGSTPEPRSIGPVNPRFKARSGVTTPMPTVRCFQIRLSVSRVS
jgi:hypothetical protein